MSQDHLPTVSRDITVEVNVLIHAVNEGSPAHGQSLAGRSTVRPRAHWASSVVLLAFIRLTTSNQVFTRPLSVSDAMGVVESWLGRPLQWRWRWSRPRASVRQPCGR